nr:VP6 [Kaptombes virus]
MWAWRVVTRLTLLAPGDIIRKAEQELKARRIDVLINNDAEKTEEEQNNENRSGEGRKEVTEGRRDEEGSRRKTEEEEGEGKDGTEGSKQEQETKEIQVRKTISENKTDGDGKDDLQTDESEKENLILLDSEIQKVIDKLYGVKLQTVDEATGSGEKIILKLGSTVLKQIGIGKEKVQEQNDALTKYKKTKTKKGRVTEIQFIESLKGLEAEIGVNSRKEVNSGGGESGVVLVTNDRRYAGHAHVIFTCPTGDVTWKDTARIATKRSDIRAYVHDPANGEPEKGLLALVDLL